MLGRRIKKSGGKGRGRPAQNAALGPPSTALAPQPVPAVGLSKALATKEIVVVCGAGGVGKTTVSAAAAAAAAVRTGGRVLVLTVDPARRLASALGMEEFGNIETRVPDKLLRAAGVRPRGELWAAMLDTKASWDELVNRHAPDQETALRILHNKLYANITGRFVQSHDYVAMERLYDLHATGEWDLIVVDTPPTRNAIDFLDAPKHMAEFFGSKFLQMLAAPYRSRLVTSFTKPFYQVADRILGSQFLSDITDFFVLFQTMGEGFGERAMAVQEVLRDRRTSFVVVTTLDPSPADEAQFFLTELDRRKLRLGGLVLNQTLPDYLNDDTAAVVARDVCGRSEELAALIAPTLAEGIEENDVARVLQEVANSFLNYRLVAGRESQLAAELSALPEVTVKVPAFDHDISDVVGLIRLGDALWN